MRRYAHVIGLAAVLTGACGPSVNLELERSVLLQRDRDWSQAASDVNRFLSFLAADASIYPPGSPVVTGSDAIRKMFTEMSAAPGFSFTWTATKAEVAGTGDVGYTTGSYSSTMGGATEKGKYVTIWKKVAGEWKAVEDIFNADGSGPKPEHTIVAASDLAWTDGPPGFPAGSTAAVVSGDPAQAMPYVLRVQVPAGYRIPPHWSATTVNVTVLSGVVALGIGDVADPATMKELGAGGFVIVPAEMHHSLLARSPATIQLHGIGPFGIAYANPGDDPRQQKK